MWLAMAVVRINIWYIMSYHEILQSIGHLYMLSFSLFPLAFVPNSGEGVCEADFTKPATGIVCILASLWNCDHVCVTNVDYHC